jgi:hypothetical protein
MRPVRIAFVVLAVFTATAAAQSTVTPGTPTRAASDTARMGTYALELTTDDGTTTGELTLKRDSDKTVVGLMAAGHAPAVKSFVREAGIYVLTAGHDGFQVIYRFKFSNDSVSGTFKMSSGLGGSVLGALRR